MISYSFIIPHKNAINYLNRCVESIPQRDDIEIIVVDDNSRDENIPVFSRDGVTIIYLDQNESKGAGHARNVGINRAQGKWLLFADCDDYYETGFLDKLDRFKEIDDIDVICYDAYVFYNDNLITNTINEYLESPKRIVDVRKLLMSRQMPWCRMFSSSFVKKIGAQYEEIPIGNDAWFVLYCGSKAEKIGVIQDKLYHYIDNPVGITKKKRPIEHHYIALRSSIRQNQLKMRNGLLSLIYVPSYNELLIRKNFGNIAFCKAILIRILHDRSFFPALLNQNYRRIVNFIHKFYETQSDNNCPCL